MWPSPTSVYRNVNSDVGSDSELIITSLLRWPSSVNANQPRFAFALEQPNGKKRTTKWPSAAYFGRRKRIKFARELRRSVQSRTHRISYLRIGFPPLWRKITCERLPRKWLWMHFIYNVTASETQLPLDSCYFKKVFYEVGFIRECQNDLLRFVMTHILLFLMIYCAPFCLSFVASCIRCCHSLADAAENLLYSNRRNVLSNHTGDQPMERNRCE